MKKNFVIGVIGAGVLVAGYLAWASNAGTWPFAPAGQQEEESAVPTGWKTYESTRYGFQVSYPPTGTLISTLETTDTATIAVEGGSASAANSVKLVIRPYGQTIGAAQWEETTLDSRRAYRRVQASTGGVSVATYVVEVGRSQELVITLPQAPVYDDILASFRFTGTLFSDSAYPFSFELPTHDWNLTKDGSGTLQMTDGKGTTVTIQRIQVASTQELVVSQTTADETYVASPYAGILVRKAGTAQVVGQEKYLAWQGGTGVVFTLTGSETVADRDAFLRILSTFRFK